MPHLKYSSGKWIPTPSGFVHAVENHEVKKTICECMLCDDDGEEMTANTRLMAAAPEMYEILKAICEYSPDFAASGEINDFTVAIYDAQKLLARIEDLNMKKYERRCYSSYFVEYYTMLREQRGED